MAEKCVFSVSFCFGYFLIISRHLLLRDSFAYCCSYLCLRIYIETVLDNYGYHKRVGRNNGKITWREKQIQFDWGEFPYVLRALQGPQIQFDYGEFSQVAKGLNGLNGAYFSEHKPFSLLVTVPHNDFWFCLKFVVVYCLIQQQ